jgi:hypothetical protein
MSVLLGGQSARTKRSTGARGGVARRGRGRKGEKGGGVGSVRGEGEKRGGLVAQRRLEEESMGGPSGQQGTQLVEVLAGRASATSSRGAGGACGPRVRVWAGRGKGWSWAGPKRNIVDFDLK